MKLRQLILLLVISILCICQNCHSQSSHTGKKIHPPKGEFLARYPNVLSESQQRAFTEGFGSPTYSISTSSLTVEFYNATGGFAISQIKQSANNGKINHNFLLPWTKQYSAYPTLWQIEIVGQEGLQSYYDSTSNAIKEVIVNTKEKLTFQYNLTDIQFVINCTIVSINDNLEFFIEVQRTAQSLHCATYVYYPMITDLGSLYPANDTMFYPVNYGQVFNDPGRMNILLPLDYYPSTYTSFQYMNFYHNNQSGIYFGAHDPNGYTKNFYFRSDSYIGGDSFHFPHSEMGIFNYPSNLCVRPGHSDQLDFTFVSPYKIILTDFVGSWWDAAQIYREWVLPNAVWTQKGPIRQRADFPSWYIENTLWVNTNWLPGVLNCSLGDPEHVMKVVLEAQKIIQIPFAVHWYCWEFYPFDTNYPDYLPAKQGFKESIDVMHDFQIRILPYINGRLYDINAPSYNVLQSAPSHVKKNVNNTGLTYDASVKVSAPRMNNRTPYQVIEVYASGQYMAVMCPYTSYWQSIMNDKAEEISVHFNTDGLYIDQIGAAAPYLCADPSHSHPTLGGYYWVEGYNQLLDQMGQTNGNQRIFVTEENAESYMSSVQGFLSLSPYSECNMVPAWMTIYGGYQMSVGRTFTKADLLRDGSGFTFKMGQMFIFGAQMGWFALSGEDGIGEIIFNEPSYAPVVDYMVSLSKYRKLAIDFLVFGRLLRPLEMYVGTQEAMIIANGCLPLPITQASVWEAYNSTSSMPVIAALFTNTSPLYNDTIDTTIDLRLYPVLPDRGYKVTRYSDDGSSSLFGIFEYPYIKINTPLNLLKTLYLVITLA